MKYSSTNVVSTRNNLIWALLLTLGTGTYLAGYFFPPTISFLNEHPFECPTSIIEGELGYSCHHLNSPEGDTFALWFRDAEPDNQFVALEGVLKPSSTATSDQVKISTEVSVFSIQNKANDGFKIEKAFDRKKSVPVTFVCNLANRDALCQTQTFGQLVGLEKTTYLFVIKFLDMDNTAYKSITDFKLAITTYNTKFANYLGIFKIALFAISVIGYAIFRAYLGKVATELQTSEQRYIGYLGFILLLFNQPFFSYLPSEDNLFILVFGVVVVSAQAAFLYLLWFVLVERLASNDTTLSPSGKTLIKIVAVIHFVVSVGGYYLQARNQIQRPQDDLNTNTDAYIVFYRTYLYIFTAVVALWTVIRLFRVLRKYKELDWRDGTSFTFALCYIICFTLYTVSGSLQVDSYKGSRVVLLYGISTLYTLLFQVIYAPFEYEIEESDKRRKYETPESQGQIGDLDMSDNPSNARNDKVELRRADQNAKNSESYDDI